MNAPATMVRRRLTINFQRSVSGGTPQVMEVVVAPLTDPSSPNNDATLVGGSQSQDVLLADENNACVFELVPTDSPDLTDRLTYRIAWREKYMGRQFTKDFVMPDFDCSYDDLQDLGNVIGGETYLQQSDRGRPGGVAGLNQQGQVIDSSGNVVSGAEAAAIVDGKLSAEVVARQQADQLLRVFFNDFATQQVAQVYTITAANLSEATGLLGNADLIEKNARQAADAALAADITGLTNSTDTSVAGLEEEIDGIHDQLGLKADLVSGKIPSSQLPSIALGHAVAVADQAAMLALTSDQVQPGDLAVRPDGTFYLNAAPASTLSNWVKLSNAATITAVNNQIGDVHLGAGDVGARPVGVALPIADITGLQAALDGKTASSTTSTLAGRVTAIENDTTIVKTVSGTIPHAKQGSDVAFLNGDNQIVNKAGQVINLGGGGGLLDIADVTGLQAALDAKLPANDASVTNSRTPTAHAASHGAGQSDALTLTTAQITGLAAIISNNSLSSSSNHGNRIFALEAGGGGGGGGGSPAKTAWFDGPSATTDFSTVVVKSPFGKALSDGHLYYDPAGAAEGEGVWPYITPNGHLQLRQRNEAAGADPALATQSALDAAIAVTNTKAAQADLDTANAAILTKAAQTALDATNAAVNLRATSATVSGLADIVATKASQSALDTTNAAVSLKASAADLTTLTTTVNTKANQSALDTTNTNVAARALQTALDSTNAQVSLKASAADLATLATTVGAKANASALTPITTDITALQAALPGKADLVSGKVPTAQLPALAFNTVVMVNNRGAMLSLTTGQVQPGDICIISATVDKGSYILSADDPSVFSNWVKMPTPDAPVTSIQGQTGDVVIAASDVGARSSSVAILQSEVSGLPAALVSKADQTALTSGLAGKTAPADVQVLISGASQNKLAASLVATSPVATLSGQQSIDGVLAPLGATVLLTAQAASAANGLYVVASGAWSRATDMNAGDYFVRGTLALVTGGVTNHDTIWQQTSSSGLVATNNNNWTKVMIAGAPPTYTASLGVQKVAVGGGSDFRAQVVSGGGIQAVSGGLQLDPNVACRKIAVDVPASATVFSTITHNLNTTDVQASFRDKSSGDATLIGWKPVSVNAISAEFDSAPSAAQWRAVITG